MTSPIRPPGAQPVEGRTGSGLSPRDPGPVHSFQRRPLRVDARRVSNDNAAEVADWCGGSVLGRAVRVEFERGDDRWQLLARPGMWIVLEDEGAGLTEVLTDVQFAHSIRQVRP